MKNRINRKTGLASAVVVILFSVSALTFPSCRKKEEKPDPAPEDTEQTTVADNNLAENIAADIEGIGAQASENSQLTTYKTTAGSVLVLNSLTVSPCASVTTIASTRIFTVDFGTSGCTGQDGHTRTGKLIFDFSASPSSATLYRNPGFTMNVTSLNYIVDGHQVTINNKTIANTSPLNLPPTANPGTNLTWSVTSAISIAKNSGGTISWNCNRTKELINTGDSLCYNGQSHPINWSNAMVKLNGTASGTNARGESYTATGTNLVRDFTCNFGGLHPRRHPFVSGTMAYTPGTRPTRLIDYGAGACDQIATMTINGNTYTITLP
jgi:hypothetical protein